MAGSRIQAWIEEDESEHSYKTPRFIVGLEFGGVVLESNKAFQSKRAARKWLTALHESAMQEDGFWEND